MSTDSTLLHGDLKLTIIEARALGELSKLNSFLRGLLNMRAIKDWRVTVSVAKTAVARSVPFLTLITLGGTSSSIFFSHIP
ncbi:hypothetical protein SLA2020_377690 [Shorea laevis]